MEECSITAVNSNNIEWASASARTYYKTLMDHRASHGHQHARQLLWDLISSAAELRPVSIPALSRRFKAILVIEVASFQLAANTVAGFGSGLFTAQRAQIQLSTALGFTLELLN